MHAVARLAALLWLYAAATHAADVPALRNAWYRTEIVIFERLDDAAAGEQLLGKSAAPLPLSSRAFVAADPALVYPLAQTTLAEPPLPTLDTALAPAATDVGVTGQVAAALPPTPVERARALLDDYEDSLFAQCFQWQPAKTLQLTSQAARLGRSGRFRVLLHGAWIAPIPDRDSPLPMLLQTGERSGDRWRVEGTIAVTLGRYLHADVALRYLLQPLAGGNDDFSAPDYLELQEVRRLRSGELHYLDHPRFGVLLQIDPVTLPDALSQQIDALLAPPAPPTGPAQPASPPTTAP
jgi:Peptidoglycan-binding protein, CsiV